MVDTMQKTQTVGGITKTYVIRDGVLGNVTAKGDFYKLSDYELQHDVSNVQRDAAGKVTFYTLSGADAAQYAAAQAAKEAAAKQAAQAAAQKAAANAAQKIDPQKTSGYAFKYAMSHSDQNVYLREKQSNPSLTEYQWRKSNGKDLTVVKGTYVAPKMTTSNKSAASTGTKQTGVSNDKTGSEKLAAQSKTNASTNKATVKTTTTTKNTTPAKKTVVSLDAAKSGNASKTSKTTPTKTVVTTKQAASGNAAKTTPTTKKTVVSTKQASSGNAAKTTPTSKKIVSTAVASSGTVAKNTASTASSGTGNVKKVNTQVSTKPQKSTTYIPVVRSATGVIISQQTTKTDPNMDRNTTGLSRKISGSEKLAAQNKTNASTNKAVILNRVEAPKTIVSLDAARRGNAAATTPKPAITEPTTKVVVSLAAAASGNAAKTVPKSANQSVQYVRTGLNIPMAEMTSGSQKLAAQSKINASTNKPTIIKKPVQPSVQPIVTKKPTMQLTPFDSTATPVIVKKPATTPVFNKTQTTDQTTSKKSVFSTVSNLFGPDESGFGIIGVASAKAPKPTNADIQKYTKDPRFKPCPTGLCKVNWRDNQIANLKAIDARAAQTQTTQTTQKPPQTTQKPQTQTTQTTKTTQTTQKPQTITQTITQVPIESQPTEIRVTRQREDPQWHEAVQNILKQDMMARYGLDARGNKINSSIQLADGSYIEQVQTQGNSRDSGVKLYTAQLTDAEKAQNWAAYQERSGLGQKIYRDSVKVGTIQGTVENKNAAEAKAAAKAEAARIKALQAAFTGNTKVGASGEVIDAIQSRGNDGSGERNVSIITKNTTGNITGLSKSKAQFQSEAKYREQIANIPIVAGMTTSDINTIKQARQEVQARTLSKLTYPGDEEYYKQQAQQKAIQDYRSQGKIQNVLGAAYDATKDVKSIKSSSATAYDNALTKLDKADKWASKKLAFLPSGEQIEKTVAPLHFENAIKATPFAGLALTGEMYDTIEKKLDASPNLRNNKVIQLAEKSIKAQQDISNALTTGSKNFLKNEYDSIRTKPVSTGIEYGAYYAGGEIFGAVTKGSKLAAASGLTKAAEKSSGFLTKKAEKIANPWAKKTLSILEKRTTGALTKAATKTDKVIDFGMMGLLATDYGRVAGEGYEKGGAAGIVESSLKFGEALAIGGVGFHRGIKAVEKKSPFLLLPTAETATLQAIPKGASATVADIEVGKTLAIANRPIISYSDKGGLKLGSPEIDTKLIHGKRIHPYSKLDTRILDTHIKKNFGESDKIYWFGGRTIATKGYKAPRPIVEPTRFEVLSKNIPDTMKPTVRDTIVEYGKKKDNEIQVYGSNALKMQMGKYLSGTPKDIEVSVDSVAKFSNAFKTNAEKAGFVEGKDFRITVDGKIVTKVVDDTKPKIEFNSKKGWEKGIEVFSHEKDPVTGKVKKSKYRTEENLPFGFKMKPSIKSESVDIMPMQEQAVRNYRGGTTLKDGKIEPEHEGRIKDIRRLIETGVGNENTFNTGIKPTILEYSKTMVEKYPSVKESPISEYMAEQGKFPNKAQSFVLNSDIMTKPERYLVVRAIDRKTSGDLRLWNKKGTNINSQKGELSILGQTKKGLTDMMTDESGLLGGKKSTKKSIWDIKATKDTKSVNKLKLKSESSKPEPRLSRKNIAETKEPVERELIFESRGKGKIELLDEKFTDISKALGSKPIGSRPLGLKLIDGSGISANKPLMDINGGLGINSKSSRNIFRRNDRSDWSKEFVIKRDTDGKSIGISHNSKGLTLDRKSIETNPPIAYTGSRKPTANDDIKSKPINDNSGNSDSGSKSIPPDDNSKPIVPTNTDDSKPPNDDSSNSKPPEGEDPHPPVPEYGPDDRSGGGGGRYEGFIDFNKHDPIEDGERILKRKKSGAYEKLPWGMASEALMISKTKVNTFSEMLGHTGEKAAYGSETKVTKIERPSPFNKKVTTPTVKSFTPVALNVAQKGLERKLDVIAKTPVKYYGAVPENVKQKSVTISRKPTNSKPRSQSNSVPVKQIFTPKKQVSFAKPSFSSVSKATSPAKPKANPFAKPKATIATKRKSATPWG